VREQERNKEREKMREKEMSVCEREHAREARQIYTETQREQVENKRVKQRD